MSKLMNNNQAVVAGEIISDFEYSHEVFGERFYFLKLRVSRLSDSNDIIPLLISERLIDVNISQIGRFMEVQGQFRSYNQHQSDRNHLILSLFVRSYRMLEDCDDYEPNMIFLDGYICKEPIYRTTPFGREIADLLVAVNRAYSKSDYIPCICWGRNARYAEKLPVGSRVRLWGRIQSREYQKKTKANEESAIKRTVYEISINKMESRCEEFEDNHILVADSREYGFGSGSRLAGS